MSANTLAAKPTELIKADTALRSFRDGGYVLADAVGEIVDNSLQSGATKLRLDWEVSETHTGKAKSQKTHRQLDWVAVGDNGSGIPAAILANVLTVGFSTRYGSRDGIGRFGVGFKLASISQAKRLEIYTRPAFLKATKTRGEDGRDAWTFSEANEDGRVFKTYLDLEAIDLGEQKDYRLEEVDEFPEECAHLMEDADTGTLILWRNLDRLNHEQSFAEKVDEKLESLAYFLRRTYRVFINNGIELYLQDNEKPLLPYDPLFEIDNPEATQLANGKPMKGEYVDSGKIVIDGHEVKWLVQLTPPITRLEEGGGGEDGPAGKGQFKRLHIPDNRGKISFLRHNREISYTTVPKFLPDGIDWVDCYVGIQIAFPPALDEYFQVKHIKRGAEPIEKLREALRKELKKPVTESRKRVRKLWLETKKDAPKKPDDASGGRTGPEDIAKKADPGLPSGKAGLTVPPSEEEARLRQAAADVGIKDPVKQDEFIKHAKQKPMVALDVDLSGSGLLELEHLTHTVLVRINRRHPFVKQVYQPIRDAITAGLEGMEPQQIVSLLEKAADGIDLLFFAYAKAENMSQQPDEDYGMLRDDWGKFAAVYVRDRSKMSVS
jgi:hypothetical protein